MPQRLKKPIQKILRSIGFQIVPFKNKNALWQQDPEFERLYENIRPLTLINPGRCYSLYQFAKASVSREGAFAEFGVYKGGTAKMLAELIKGTKKELHLFDTFEGMEETVGESPEFFRDTSLELVKKNVGNIPNVFYHKGLFPQETGKEVENKKFSFVNMDVDLYSSTKEGLGFFYDRLTPGGILISDDYNSPAWPGVARAFHEFAEMRDLSIIKPTHNQCMLIKV